MSECTDLLKSSHASLKKIIGLRQSNIEKNKTLKPDDQLPTEITGIVKNGQIDEITASIKRHNYPEGFPVVYASYQGEDGSSRATPYDIIELATKDRPYICKVAYNAQMEVKASDKGKDLGTINCFSLSDPIGTTVANIINTNINNIKKVREYAKAQNNSSDEEDWSVWQRKLLKELKDQADNLEEVLTKNENSAGHRFPREGDTKDEIKAKSGSMMDFIVTKCGDKIR